MTNTHINGAHGRLTYDIHDKHWIPHIGINDPSNCKADTKNKGYQEIMFFRLKNTNSKKYNSHEIYQITQ